MDDIEKANRWLEFSQNDYEAAKIMLDNSRWLYVCFMCQQAVEKAVKALYIIKKKSEPPFVHNIRYILELIDDEDTKTLLEKYSNFFDRLTGMYIETRYVTYKDRLIKSLNKNITEGIYNKSGEVLSCLRSLIEKK